jgi:hypothetical protein
MFYRLSLLTCSESELNFETLNPFRNVDRTPWLGSGEDCIMRNFIT